MAHESQVRRVVVGVDGSEHSMTALRYAADEARLRQVPLRVVYGWSTPVTEVPPGTAAEDSHRGRAQQLVDNALTAVGGDLSGVDVETLVDPGDPTSVLLSATTADDLLVVGSRGRGGFRGLLLGSVSQQLVTHAPCPVLVVRPADG